MFSQVPATLRDLHPNVVVKTLHWTARKHSQGLCILWEWLVLLITHPTSQAVLTSLENQPGFE